MQPETQAVGEKDLFHGQSKESEERFTDRKKIVLMALAMSGRNTLCKKFLDERFVPPRDDPYCATIDYQIYKRVIHGTEFSIFNLGGQSVFLDRYIGEIVEAIFGGIDSLVFIFDTIELKDVSRAKYYFDEALNRVQVYSPKASVFLFLNKIDLLPRDVKDEVCHTIKEFLLKGVTKDVRVYKTSIFDSSSTKAVEAVYRENIRIFAPDLLVDPIKIAPMNDDDDEMLTLAIREALRKHQVDFPS